MSASQRLVALAVLAMLASTGCLDLFGGTTGHHSRSEWAYEMTEIVAMNEEGFTGSGVIVGIVDTGFDAGHESLKGADLIAWRDFIYDREEPYDDNGHGSHVAGIIAGSGDIVGAAPDAQLVVAKALDDKGKGSDSVVADAIDWVVDQGAHVICLSLGGRSGLLSLGSETRQSCNRALNRGVFIVAAAGNDGEHDDGDVATPADIDKVIAVGAVDENRRIAKFSSMGDNDGESPLIPPPLDTDRQDPDKKPEVVAPGVDILSAWKDGDYAKASGTSQATAFVAAIVALELEAHPGYKLKDRNTIDQFKRALQRSAQPCPGQETPHDDHYGYGLIQALQLHREL